MLPWTVSAVALLIIFYHTKYEFKLYFTISHIIIHNPYVFLCHSDTIGFRSPTSLSALTGVGLNGGNTSPGQGRSLREYDEKMHVLQKENFHLKLRLFFLEEKTPGTGTSKSEDETLFKQNVDLKVIQFKPFIQW